MVETDSHILSFPELVKFLKRLKLDSLRLNDLHIFARIRPYFLREITVQTAFPIFSNFPTINT